MTEKTLTEPERRRIFYRKYVLWLGLALLAASLIAYFRFSYYSGHTMQAMNCGILEPIKFEKVWTTTHLKPVYGARKNEPTSPVTFKFNLAPSELKDTILVIRSNKVHLPVYRAPYQEKIVVQAGADLLNNDGFDSFQIRLLNPITRLSCTEVHETTAFWQANKTVFMDFLPDRELDMNGRPVGFKVRIE